jgi:hypothetical protein
MNHCDGWTFQRNPIKNESCSEEGHQWGGKENLGMFANMEFEECIMLEDWWMKESRSLSMMSEGVSKPWPSTFF